MKLQFLGGAQTVTGSRTLLTHRGYRALVDCGLFQGAKEKRLLNWNAFVDANKINSILLTHAHIDHSGYIPKIVKEGFTGPIYCSPGTLDLTHILLLDSAHLQEEDAQYANEVGYSNHTPAEPLYNTEDAVTSLRQLQSVKDETWNKLSEHIDFRLVRSGHILGSRFVILAYQDSQGTRTITFSGDLGNGRSQVIKSPVTGLETDDLVLESTYGNRSQSKTDPGHELAKVITRIADRQGVLVIPAFSVGRTQEILLLIRQLEDQGTIPKIPVYLDSPMANHATEIYLRHSEDHQLVSIDGELQPPISTNGYLTVRSNKESKALAKKSGPMIIISAAGMLTGGRVMHHLKSRLPNPENAVLFVGYQAEGTKGRLLQDGIGELRIHHEAVPVKAEVVSMEGLSAHADADETIKWLKSFRRGPTRIFINHGEKEASLALAQRIKAELGIEVVIPQLFQEFDLSHSG